MSKLEEATFGAGCFWGPEELYRTTPGVKETESGYMGGSVEEPSYEEVATRTTGHAEVVHIKFDPKEVTYEKLLELFWNNHNPTTLNRQGLNIGPEYRSVIFFHTSEQEKIARKSKEEMEKSGKFP
ncbi:MAG TPA: peptide-methionine (S)-S-oxide reductase, partial [bacterium]|nr:peptide-methionine (S)-S-oxide reductase [bacterium]